MEQIIDQTILTIFSLIIGIVGIVVSIIVTILNKVQVRPILYYENFREVSKLSDGNRKIKVFFGNDEVSEVSTSRIWFYNKGRKPIKKAEIPENDPLKIVFTNSYENYSVSILDYKILKVSKESSNFNLIPIANENAIQLDFDYIDYNEGAVFEIQHNGSYHTKVSLNGVVLGPKKKTKIIENIVGEVPTKLYHDHRKKGLAFKVLSTAILITIVFISSFFFPKKELLRLTPEEMKTTVMKQLKNQSLNDTMFFDDLMAELKLKSKRTEDIRIIGIISFFILLVFFILFYRELSRNNYPKGLKLEIQKPNTAPNIGINTDRKRGRVL